MGVNTVNVGRASRRDLVWCIAAWLKWAKRSYVATGNWIERTFSDISITQFEGFTTSIYTCTPKWSLRSLEWPLSTTVRLNAGKCTEQQYIVISNINDIKNIYTCNLTALVNILRHFCNSIDLLVSAIGNNNRTHVFFFQKKETEREMARYLSYSHFKTVVLWLSLCLSSLWDCLGTKESLACSSQRGLLQNNKIQRQDVFPLRCEVCFVYGETRPLGGCLDVTQWRRLWLIHGLAETRFRCVVSQEHARCATSGGRSLESSLFAVCYAAVFVTGILSKTFDRIHRMKTDEEAEGFTKGLLRHPRRLFHWLLIITRAHWQQT